MPLSPSPDLSSPRRLAATALVVTVAVCALLVWRAHDIITSLGDTDDAMRLVLVRDLLHGRGWYDQWVDRLQPPVGAFMHWSRLLDGALASAMAALRLLVPPERAEVITRFAWPLAWIFPVSLAGLAMARALGARSAVFICAVLCVMDVSMYVQFRPGRIDHHNIQITLTMASAALALARGRRRVALAAAAGAASALGLAIGVEALAFHALIGASFGVRLAADREEAAAARAYGLSLACTALALFLVQTPPARWGLPVCDALGPNLVLTLATAGLGLAVVATAAVRASDARRLVLVVLVGLAAAGAYVLADPVCLRGPFGTVDPRVRPFWFDHIQELEAWPTLLREARDEALHSIIAGVASLAAALWLAVRAWRAPRRGDWLLAGCVVLAVAAQAKAYRMEDYGLWFGAPALAIALADVSAWALRDRMLAAGALAVALSPATLADGVLLALRAHPPQLKAPADHCFDTASYARLAGLPAGVVLAEPDLGPFVLANTPDAVMSAPYHRMNFGILATHDALAAAAAAAEERVRALRARYILDCPVHRLRLPAGSLGDDLRHGRLGAWLSRLSPPGEPVQIYQVTPLVDEAAPFGAALRRP
jgi:hypothetical protein